VAQYSRLSYQVSYLQTSCISARIRYSSSDSNRFLVDSYTNHRTFGLPRWDQLRVRHLLVTRPIKCSWPFPTTSSSSVRGLLSVSMELRMRLICPRDVTNATPCGNKVLSHPPIPSRKNPYLETFYGDWEIRAGQRRYPRSASAVISLVMISLEKAEMFGDNEAANAEHFRCLGSE
jgi:hypothetical protein